MKKNIITTLALVVATALMADTNVALDKKEMNLKMTKMTGEKVGTYAGMQHKVAELVPLPHLKRLMASNKEILKINKEQKEKIKTQIFENIRTKVHEKIKIAEQLEEKITTAVLKEQKSKEALKEDIEALIDIKRDITNGHIDALNTLAKILTKEQYEKVLILVEENKRKHGGQKLLNLEN